MTEQEVIKDLIERHQTTKTKLSFNEWIMAKKTRAIIIDPFTRETYEVILDGSLQDMYHKIGYRCELVERITIDGFTELWLDEEGLYKDHANEDGIKYGFQPKQFLHPLWGRAIVTGKGMKDTKLSVDGVRTMIKHWVTAKGGI
jgi:hypothetical protein